MSTKRKKEKLPNRETASISSSFVGDLPQDIILSILTLLPVKTLIRFMCVCKSWYNLTSNPSFIKNHLQNSYSSNNYTNHKLILTEYDTAKDLFSIKSLSLDFSDDNNDIHVLGYPTSDITCKVQFIGSCNGLVLMKIKEVGAFLWNPSTRISRQLTDLVPKCLLDFRRIYGFGYDQINDDYKLVWMASASGATDEKEVKIYSFGTNSLRKIAKFPHGFPSIREGTYVNGALHWPVVSITIVSLDLGTETYGEITQPCYGRCNLMCMSLGVLEGCLSACYWFREPKGKLYIDIWVMKEYGVIKSWIKMYTSKHKQGPNRVFNHFPLCITMSGEILLEHRRRLILYNPTNGKFRNPRGGKLLKSEILTYVESLVSPKLLMRCESTTLISPPDNLILDQH